MRLEPAAHRSRVKHSTTEPLRSPNLHDVTVQLISVGLGNSTNVVTGNSSSKPDQTVSDDKMLLSLYSTPLVRKRTFLLHT